MPRIALADNCPLIAKGLKAIFRAVPEWKLETTQMGNVFELLSKKKFRVLILELEICGQRRIEVLEKLSARFPRTRVLVYTSNSHDQVACAAIRSGAAGYVRKDSDERNLLEAIRTVISGEMYIEPALAHKLALLHFTKREAGGPYRLSVLSKRERQVFEAIVNGKRPKEIAAHLSISAKTVGTYQTRLFQKLGLKSHADLFRVAYEQGFGT
jgi:two-component system, NarL family, invasion response regulator UvrY